MRANLQLSCASCANCSEQTVNQNTNIVADVCKVVRKRTSGLTVKGLCHSDLMDFWPRLSWKLVVANLIHSEHFL